MEVTTLSNLVALAVTVSGLQLNATDAHLTEEAFDDIIEEVFNAIDLLSKWEARTEMNEEGRDNDSTEESDDNEDSETQEANTEVTSHQGADNTECEEDEVLSFHLG